MIEQRLKQAQINKDFKDLGRKGGTRKEKVAYNLISVQVLDQIEDDPILAEKLVTKSKVWPLVDVAQEKAAGTSAGAAFLKLQYQKALAAKPFNSGDARRIYVGAIEFFIEALKSAKTVKDVKEIARRTFQVDTLEQITPQLAEFSRGLPSWSARRATIAKIEGVFGKNFINLVKGGTTDATAEKVYQAELYEGFTAEQEAPIRAAAIERQRNTANEISEVLVAAQAATNAKELRRALSKFWNIPSDRELTPFEDAKARWITIVGNSLKKYQGDVKLKPIYLARNEDWSWAEIKEPTKRQKNDGPRINAYEYLARLTRKGGLFVSEKDNASIKQKYQLHAIQYGNSLTDTESANLTYWLNGSFSDLQEILNLNIGALHHAGGLGIDFATRGTAGSAATFWPSYSVINLNRRNGDGSLAHEWGHFLDHLIATNVTPDKYQKINGQLGKMATSNGARSAALQYKLDAIMQFIHKGSGTETVNVLVKAKKSNLNFYKGNRSFEDNLQYYRRAYPGSFTSSNFNESVGHLLYIHGIEEYDYEHRLNSSWQYYDSSRMGSKYWVNKAELFARAFEGYVMQRMQEMGMVSDFLQSPRKFLIANFGRYPYPYNSDMEYLAPMFDQLLAEVRQTYNAQPLPIAAGANRVNVVMDNTSLDGDTKLKPSVTEKQQEIKQELETPEETCQTCEYDQHCDNLKRDTAETMRDAELAKLTEELAGEDAVPELVVLDNLPHITPESARKETGGKVGTTKDVALHFIRTKAKGGVSVERAAELILARHENLPLTEAQVRDLIIDILKEGKANFRQRYAPDSQRLLHEAKEKEKQFVAECIGDTTEEPKPQPKDTTAKKTAGAKGYMATRLKMAQRGDFKSMNHAQVLAEARKFQAARQKSGAALDEKKDSRQRLSPTPENLVRWMNAPGKFDLIGIDTHKKNDPTADLKLKKEIFWHRLLKK